MPTLDLLGKEGIRILMSFLNRVFKYDSMSCSHILVDSYQNLVF